MSEIKVDLEEAFKKHFDSIPIDINNKRVNLVFEDVYYSGVEYTFEIIKKTLFSKDVELTAKTLFEFDMQINKRRLRIINDLNNKLKKVIDERKSN